MAAPGRIALILAFIWIVLVVAVLGWQAATYSGLYRGLAEWQQARWGSYDSKMTGLIPGFLLVLPALAVLRRQPGIGPATPRRVPGLVVARRFTLGLGLLASLVAVGAWLWSQRLPDPSDPPVTVDLVALGTVAPAIGAVQLAGARADPARTLVIEEKFRSNKAPDMDHRTLYVPVLAADAPADAPVRFIIDRASYAFADAPESQAIDIFTPASLRGVLIADGLPADVVAAFGKQGVTLASPHYLLTTNSVGGREPFYVAAALGGIIGVLGILISLIQTAQLARARRTVS